MWDAWDASTDIGDPPLTGYRVYYMLNNSREEEQEVRRYDRLAPSETVTGLSPYTAYMFCVSAFRPGVGGSGSRMEVEGTTQCSPPSRGPSSVYVTKGTRPGEILVSWENPPSMLLTVSVEWEESASTSLVAPAPTVSVEATSETVTVRWDAASPAHLNGDVQGYQLRYTQTKPEPLDPVIVDVMGNKYEITDGVTGDSEFEIEVRVLNGAGYGKWSPLMTSPLTGDESRYSLRALLVTALIPSIVILLICVICIILIVGFFRRRQPGKGESEKSTHDDSQSPETANTYQDLYERVSNEGTDYQEIELTSVPQGDTDYINI
eukprot:XP_011662637.1 PREDICTED: uncharacterized protein LOC105437578 [Strongylocentrotus purpuratus]